MNYLYISPINGLYNEMYNPDAEFLLNPQLEIINHRLDANIYFWSQILDSKKIYKLLHFITLNEETSPQYRSIVSNKDLFVHEVENAKIKVCDNGNSPQELFAYLETLNLVCKIYSDYVFYPFILSLQDGFILENNNSKKVWEYCLNPARNPYFKLISEYVYPLIMQEHPDMIFFEGPPSFYNIAIAKLVKMESPSTLNCFTRHSSEYYSLNKIDKLLVKNIYLFNAIDVVILEYFTVTEKRIIEGESLNTILNIIYKNNEGKIEQNAYGNPEGLDSIGYTLRFKSDNIDYKIAPHKLANIHLEPYNMCFWNKCVFCGINKKYHFKQCEDTSTQLIDRLIEVKELVLHKGITHIWFIDEAIHVSKLKIIAEYFLENKIIVQWQVRSRICSELIDDNLINLLEMSGLKEIRLGLESASINVLKEMNKFDETFSLDLVIDICKLYSQHEISVHFPMIIGFPGETNYDRKYTYDFLRNIHAQYPQVTFNINIFGLDIGSPMFSKWTDYNISNIHFPCCPSYYTGNIIDWNDDNDFHSSMLSDERDKIMKDILYPWMPFCSTLEPYIFYRLSETIRDTLFWKGMEKPTLDSDWKSKRLYVNKKIVISYQDTKKIYYIYNWCNHHYMIGNNNILKIFDFFAHPNFAYDAIEKLSTENPAIFTFDDLSTLIQRLFIQDYLCIEN